MVVTALSDVCAVEATLLLLLLLQLQLQLS